MSPANTAQLVKTIAREVGFDLVGVANARPLERIGYYKSWLEAGHAGGMTYLHRHLAVRADPRRLLPGGRSVICVGMCYGPEGVTAPEAGPTAARVASYARGRDYHAVVRSRLELLVERLRSRLGSPFEARACVDTAPVLERELARLAGLGWIGRHTCLINAEYGSYILLGELVTTLELQADAPVPERCGRCRRCLEACPTGALVAPYRLDARRCLSYWTIEHRGAIPSDIQERMGNWVFGCDVCQQVCPYNRKPGARQPNPALGGVRLPEYLDARELLSLTSGQYRRLVKGTAGRRAGRNMWRRNAAVVLGNCKLSDEESAKKVRAALEQAAQEEDEGLRQAARTAQARFRAPPPGTRSP